MLYSSGLIDGREVLKQDSLCLYEHFVLRMSDDGYEYGDIRQTS